MSKIILLQMMNSDFFSLHPVDPSLGITDVLIRLLLSFIAGLLIGLERGRHKQFLSLRPHILIALGSTLIMLLSIFIPQEFGFDGNYDPGRIAAQVVSGIGFLGAGAIIRFGANVKGITTAATIWVSAAIGLAVGAGFYFPAMAATVFVLLVLVFIDHIEKRLFRESMYKVLNVYYKGNDNYKEDIVRILKQFHVRLVTINVNKDIEQKKSHLEFFLHIPMHSDTEILANSVITLLGNDVVLSVSFKTMD